MKWMRRNTIAVESLRTVGLVAMPGSLGTEARVK
jgi:hypothetical protein